MQVPVPASKLAESEIVPARIAPQLRSAGSSPHAGGSPQADNSEAAEASTAFALTDRPSSSGQGVFHIDKIIVKRADSS